MEIFQDSCILSKCNAQHGYNMLNFHSESSNIFQSDFGSCVGWRKKRKFQDFLGN